MTLYVNCKAEDFFSKYDVDKDDADAKIVFTDSDALTTVENLGDAGKIRVIKNEDGTSQILLDGVKYTTDKYATAFYSFTKTTGDAFLKNFAYTAKDGYTGANSNGAVKFIVRETKQGDDTIKTLHIYYMPYAFGQYFTRTLRDAFTSKDTSFVTIGTYAAEKIENKDGVKSNFVETLLGTTSRVTSATTSVSKKNGGFTVATREGDRLKKSDNNKKLLYHDGEYDTSFVTFRVTDAGGDTKDYLFGGKYAGSSAVEVTQARDQSRLVGRRSDLHRDGGACRWRLE